MTLRITGGELRGRRLKSARGSGIRPTSERVRGAIFSIIGRDAVEGARVLDLYAGTGALGIEALSRGAAWADFVESGRARCREIRDRLRELGLDDRSRVYAGRTLKVLGTLSTAYDLVFADPPYELDEWESIICLLEARGLVSEGGQVIAEHRSGVNPAEGYGGLRLTTSRRYGDTAVSIYIPEDING
ncbi:MAG: 16S rRNA (guanine(966)-N(2))-methyltransferase RsmD [Chloroflexi bacterium]|nr:16S rRNA (guanine(966)-N(2))-methyltransferase RsmD [Chloroflexota bacterium]